MKTWWPIIIILLTGVLVYPAAGAEPWKELRDEGDQLFDEGNYGEAAEKYNQSFHAAILAGRSSQAAISLSNLGSCFQGGRIQDPLLLTSYSNSAALAYLKAAEEQTLENATNYLTRAGYLFAFRGLEDSIGLALGEYLRVTASAIDELASEASASAAKGLWKVAGETYFEAGVLALDADDSRASDMFQMAVGNLGKAAVDASEAGGAWNLSEAGFLYHRAGIAAYLGGGDPGQLVSSGATAYSEAGGLFLEDGQLEEAKESFSKAAELYQEWGAQELARQAYREAAKLAGGLVSPGSYGDHLQALEAAQYHDAAGDYLNASELYFMAYNLIDTDLINQLPWIHAEILEILGCGRKGTIARTYASILQESGLSSVVFFASPYFSAYDLINHLGSDLEQYHRALFLDRISVTVRLMMAAGLIVNHLPGEALSTLEEIPSEAVDLDPPNRAFYHLLISAAELQKGTESDPTEFRKWREIILHVHADDLFDIFNELQPNSLYFPEGRRRSMLRSLLTDLEREVANRASTESYALEAQEILDEILGAGLRNASKHREIADLYANVAWRWVYQGLNNSVQAFESASFHACAGESFQDAVLYNDLTISGLGAMTPLSAASFRVAEAMISRNGTAKIEARDFVLGNVSKYLSRDETAILLSVLEGRTDLGRTPPYSRIAGMGFVAGFILLTAYVLLIWEPKHPLEGERGSPTSAEERDSIGEVEEDVPSNEEEEKPSEGPDSPRKGTE